MRRNVGGPGEFERRGTRARALQSSASAAVPLAVLAAVLDHQRVRAASPNVQPAVAAVASAALPNRLLDRFPLLDLPPAADPIANELGAAVADLTGDGSPVPAPLAEAGADLVHTNRHEQEELVATWLDDPALLDPRLALWIAVAAAPILESAAARVEPPSREDWTGRACPMCGDAPQCSAIVEESGGFMQGAPRYLICGRCASWWAFPRAVCPSCGEDDSRRISSYATDEWAWARVDACDTCRSYIKAFDLREKGSRDVVPLVDDVATLALDLWAHETGLERPRVSLAGV
ncbi:MAG: formate dehydrogenase accessory protein FdhE [Actinomycetota bacterium]